MTHRRYKNVDREIFSWTLDMIGVQKEQLTGETKFIYRKYFEFELISTTSYLSYHVYSVVIDGVKVDDVEDLKGYKNVNCDSVKALKKVLDDIVELNYTDSMIFRDKLEGRITKTIKKFQYLLKVFISYQLEIVLYLY